MTATAATIPCGVVGRNGDGPAYFIYWAERRSAFEERLANAGWAVDDIRKWFGFDIASYRQMNRMTPTLGTYSKEM
jgi:hypothetical protein